jgi:hypothetical protein
VQDSRLREPVVGKFLDPVPSGFVPLKPHAQQFAERRASQQDQAHRIGGAPVRVGEPARFPLPSLSIFEYTSSCAMAVVEGATVRPLARRPPS